MEMENIFCSITMLFITCITNHVYAEETFFEKYQLPIIFITLFIICAVIVVAEYAFLKKKFKEEEETAITDKTQQDAQKLSRYAEINECLLNLIPDTLIIINSELRVELVLNPRSNDPLAPDKSIIGKKTTDFYINYITDQLNAAIRDVFKTKELVTFNFTSHDGENTYYFKIMIQLLSPSKVCCLVHDFTNSRLNQLQLINAQDELEHLNHRLWLVLNTAHVIP